PDHTSTINSDRVPVTSPAHAFTTSSARTSLQVLVVSLLQVLVVSLPQ
ncbi:32074_t:CDS:1, partial [Racocetra persica]